MKNKRSQIVFILNDKIKKICQAEFKKVNPAVRMHKATKPYCVPSVCVEMVAMISECSDEKTSDIRLDEIYTFATTGEVFEVSTKTA
jgi:hypothetical protein